MFLTESQVNFSLLLSARPVWVGFKQSCVVSLTPTHMNVTQTFPVRCWSE